ncbi:unnamed protein product [Didymodactylos carnosus]|uniref:Uncharacterized protein n=1 Tax=Didymodactylos carnosus TaxID=1234261 RepID=A0A8S2R2B4_9BILA|nr:unnamed protein product [Didymodactylos carnosus]CAF4134601.1 unnamed protein product [Didymodactylos carnosus]
MDLIYYWSQGEATHEHLRRHCNFSSIDEDILWEIIDKASKQTTLARAIIRQKYLKNFHKSLTTGGENWPKIGHHIQAFVLEIAHQAKLAGYTDVQ